MTEENFHPAIELLQGIRSEYEQNRYTHIDGNSMKLILGFFGATVHDLLLLESTGNHLASDPTLPFRQSKNGRFLMDFTQNEVSRLEFQPFVLSKEEDFSRADSGQLRHFRGIQDDVQKNTAFQALLKFQACILKNLDISPRKNLVSSYDRWMSTVFHLRTITTPELLGEPAKEGVHSDGVEHTMTTLLYSENMTPDSARSFLHSNEQENALPWDRVDKKYVLGSFQHQNPFDTLLIVDTERKHTVTPVIPFDTTKKAVRDMLILFTRKLKDTSHSTHKFDTTEPHPDMPLKFPIS